MIDRRTRRGATAWMAGALVVAAIGASASAASAQEAGAQTMAGPLKIERIENQWLAAPDVKVTVRHELNQTCRAVTKATLSPW